MLLRGIGMPLGIRGSRPLRFASSFSSFSTFTIVQLHAWFRFLLSLVNLGQWNIICFSFSGIATASTTIRRIIRPKAMQIVSVTTKAFCTELNNRVVSLCIFALKLHLGMNLCFQWHFEDSSYLHVGLLHFVCSSYVLHGKAHLFLPPECRLI